MITLEDIAGLIGKVIRSRYLKALALNRLRFLPHRTVFFRFNDKNRQFRFSSILLLLNTCNIQVLENVL
mgnify:CR=1 FL=1